MLERMRTGIADLVPHIPRRHLHQTRRRRGAVRGAAVPGAATLPHDRQAAKEGEDTPLPYVAAPPSVFSLYTDPNFRMWVFI